MFKESLYRLVPHFVQQIMISIFNYFAYNKRYGKSYHDWLKILENDKDLTREALYNIQADRFKDFTKRAIANSKFYSSYKPLEVKEIARWPIVSKEMIRENISDVYTIDKSQAIISKTGGTTGKSLEVYYTKEDMQERFAFLDYFRAKKGYKLGKKTAWFSGKSLLTKRDIKKSRFWKTDYLHNVRYYSTFHIKDSYLKYYVEDLIRYQPKYLVGFPSTILEIANYGLAHGYKFPTDTVLAIFPTAETITAEIRKNIEAFFHAKMYDQYASSEGAPFVFECEEGRLHLQLRSGIFEILDGNNLPNNEGRLVLTSFSTSGTPLIRYDIGDKFVLEGDDIYCSCGDNNPIVKQIAGRIDDYIYSPENGKINLGNISNTLKGIEGVIRFQVVQNVLNAINLLLVVDNRRYNPDMERRVLRNWRERVGENMEIKIEYVDEISVQKSGKYRIVINNIKHIIVD